MVVLGAFLRKNEANNIVTTFYTLSSTECQQFLVLHFQQSYMLHTAMLPKINYSTTFLRKQYAAHSFPHDENKRHWRVNDSWTWNMDNPRTIHRNRHIMIVMAASIGPSDAKDIATSP